MKIAIASDLHLEFKSLDLKNTEQADVLVLASDIFIAQDLHDHPQPTVPHSSALLKTLGSRQRKAQEYRDFIKGVSSEFEHVLIIAGNHEFYHGKWNKTHDYLRDEFSSFSNIKYLNDNSVTIDGIRFLGSTLWTNFNRGDPLAMMNADESMNDYRVVRVDDNDFYRKLRSRDVLKRHNQSMNWITEQLTHAVPTVIITHHAPSYASITAEYIGDSLNHCYASDLSELILDNTIIKLWIHGHVHSKHDYMIGETRILANPRGYAGHESIADSWTLEYVVI